MPDIQKIVAQMTLEEKAALCTGASPWTTITVERLGVPEMRVSDGPHGLRRVDELQAPTRESRPATCFPTASCLAAAWDRDLIGEVGRALGREAIAQGVDVLLGPGVNMKRTPLCGRNFEYFSEDPYLAGELAVAMIEAIQSTGEGTSLKHYAANNQEFERFVISADIDERTLHEIYLPAFEKAVTVAKPWTVMCAYNKINGAYASEHYQLLTEILKRKWGFEGLVVSDWGAVHDRVAALKAGLDLEMPGPKPNRVQAVVDAVRNGDLDEAVLDESVSRILGVVFEAARTPKGGEFDSGAHHELARKAAAESMVLLKNNGILPLGEPTQAGALKIAVIGRSAREAYIQGSGSSRVNPTRVDVPIEALSQVAPKAIFEYAEGYPASDEFRQALIDEAVALAQNADAALLFIAPPPLTEAEGYDRTGLELPVQHVALIRAVAAAQPNTVVILNNGAPISMQAWIDAPAAVLEAWMMGQGGGSAVAEILFGHANPSGKLAETIPLRLEDTPAYLNYPGGAGAVRYGEGLFIGYRYYDARAAQVQFPFGFGLSYTSFDYQAPEVSTTRFEDVDGLTVSVEVRNSGAMAGKETVQFYVRDVQSSLVRPEKELKAFAKLELQPGESKIVSVHLDRRAFAFYHPVYKDWVTESGAFEILIGASSRDIRHTLEVELISTQDLPCVLNRESTIRAWVNDPRGMEVLEPLLMKLMGAGNVEAGNADPRVFMDMPLLSILHFQEDALDASPEETVTALLKQVRAQGD